jgi:hypothetical protein
MARWTLTPPSSASRRRSARDLVRLFASVASDTPARSGSVAVVAAPVAASLIRCPFGRRSERAGRFFVDAPFASTWMRGFRSCCALRSGSRLGDRGGRFSAPAAGSSALAAALNRTRHLFNGGRGLVHRRDQRPVSTVTAFTDDAISSIESSSAAPPPPYPARCS